jgi:hypothetical protein
MARIHYRWADVEMEASHLLKSIEYGTKGLDIPEFPTFLLYNPQDETRNIPMLVADAAHRVLDPATERDMLDRMIKADPDDSSLYLRLAGCLSA